MSWTKSEARIMKDLARDVRDVKIAVTGDIATGRPGLQENVRILETARNNHDGEHRQIRKILIGMGLLVATNVLLAASNSDVVVNLLATIIAKILGG